MGIPRNVGALLESPQTHQVPVYNPPPALNTLNICVKSPQPFYCPRNLVQGCPGFGHPPFFIEANGNEDHISIWVFTIKAKNMVRFQCLSFKRKVSILAIIGIDVYAKYKWLDFVCCQLLFLIRQAVLPAIIVQDQKKQDLYLLRW